MSTLEFDRKHFPPPRSNPKTQSCKGRARLKPNFPASVPHLPGKCTGTESNRAGLESCVWHLLAGLLGAYIVTLTLGSTAWEMVIIRTLIDYCGIAWGNACKVLSKYPSRQVLLRAGWVITVTTSHARSIFHTACQELPPPTATRFIVDLWLFTENQWPGSLFWLPVQSCLPLPITVIFWHQSVTTW